MEEGELYKVEESTGVKAEVKSRDSLLCRVFQLCVDTIHLINVVNSLRSVGNKPITYENEFLPRRRALLSDNQLKYVETY